MSRIDTLEEFEDVCYLGAKFLYCGSLEADLPYKKCEEVREEHRKIGLGLMGMHEWLLKRNYDYSFNPELHSWMKAYEQISEIGADEMAMKTGNSLCHKFRAVAPAGTISILAGTTSGIEPIFAIATKRRYLDKNQEWTEEYYIDPTALELQKQGVNLEDVQTAYKLSENPRKRIQFQADLQEYVDMGISSTIQLPAWTGSMKDYKRAGEMYSLLKEFAPKLRGITFYPDGSRGGQPLTEVSIEEAQGTQASLEAAEASANAGCKGGVCGI